MTSAKRLVVLGLCIAPAVVAGCGGSITTDTVTVTTPSTSTTAATTAPSDDRSQARQRAAAVRRARSRAVAGIVRSYYGNLDAKRLAAAWARLSPAVRAQLGGYDSWSAGQEGTTAVRVTSVHTEQASKTFALVDVALRSTSVDMCSRVVHQTFAGTWTLGRRDGHWSAVRLRIEKTGGGTERTDYTECDDSGGGSDAAPAAPDYTPADTDVPEPSTEDDPGFCDTHDCIPNFDNGNGSVVKCADGTYSHSGGIQGACSHHGGVG